MGEIIYPSEKNKYSKSIKDENCFETLSFADLSLNNKIKKLFKFSVEAGFFTQGIIFVGFLVSGGKQ